MILDYTNLDLNKLNSKIIKEYIKLKEENKDTIVLMQVGSFYECYFMDAKILSDVTGITLTSKFIKEIGKIALAGIPINNLNIYIKKLLNENYKICVSAQFEDEQKEFYRKPIRIYTKGTISETEFLDSNEYNYILAIYKDEKQYVISYSDVSIGICYDTFGSYFEIMSEIEKINPCEILILKEQKEEFENLIKKYNSTILDDIYIKNKNIQNVLKEYCNRTQKNYVTKINGSINYSINEYMKMDNETRRNLELTRIKATLKKKGSLYSFLNYTKTPMGSRLLKTYISEPILDKTKIIQRQDAIEELLKENKLEELSISLDNFCDLSRISTKITNSTILPKDLLLIAENSQALEDLYRFCKNSNSNLLKINTLKLNKTLDFMYSIKKAIKKDCSDELKSGNIIQDNYNTDLDYLKNKLYIIEKEIKKYEKQEQNLIPNLKISYSKNLGYYIEIQSCDNSKIASNYFKIQTLQKYSRYKTERLKELEEETYKLKYQINELEYSLFCDIKKNALNFSESIKKLAENIAHIDVLFSLSTCAKINNLVKPSFNDEKIEIKKGFHPSLINLKDKLYKNDTYIKNNSIIVLTGANMSGKSTYLKYNAIIVLLAQIGSYVPAQNANLEIIDNLILRQGANDNILDNTSSFMNEMKDLKYILDTVTKDSFVLLDEPAKSTNNKEGGAIARAFCEYILNNIKTKMLIATHNIELTKLETNYPDIVFNYSITYDNSNSEFSNRKIIKGTTNSSQAINTAELANLPREIINKAKEYTK